MKKLFSFLAVIIILLTGFLIACSDSDGEMEGAKQTPYYSTEGDVKIFTDEMVNYSTPGDSELDLVLDGNTPSEALPKKGEIICIKPCDKFVSGFVGKVEDIMEENNKFIVQTSIPALTEIFEYLSLDVEAVPNPEDMLILDPDGNEIDVILDTETSAEDLINGTYSATAQTRGSGNWENTISNVYKISYTTKKEEDNNGFKVEGKLALASTTKFAIDINDHHLDYLKYNINPRFYAGLNFSAESERGWEYSGKDAFELFHVYPFGTKGLIITTPAGIPVVLHPKLAVFLENGVTGKVSLTSTVQWRCGADLGIEKKSRNSECVPYCKKHDYTQSSPFAASEIEIAGEAYIGLGTELSVGFYTKGAAVGATLSGKLAADASFSLDAINYEVSNPEVNLGIYVNASVFAKLSLFDEKLNLEARFNVLSDWKVLGEHLWLLPEYSQFEANASGTNGEISYYVDPMYILRPAPGFQSGIAILDSNESIITTRTDDNTPTRPNALLMHIHSVDGLVSGTTYYACPWVKWGPFEWLGEKHEFSTEATYYLGFRCVNQSYDVIKFSFSLNNSTENAIDYTTDATDYGGSPMRVHITAQYNASTKTLDGIFDFFFYTYPEQQRKDGFTVSLATDDSGYVDCTKVIDNGGCYAALRIYKQSSGTDGGAGVSPTKVNQMKSYDKPLYEDDCNIGIYNKYYQK